ncbi:MULTISPECIES: NAD(P)/FAD-dependent oxidoreductase [Sphingomonas]|uniref:NAD(P)/FAD-dependent oxidoreductase n=1 Tax=Sphingomonas TaxID=13687 RepID=UPI001F07D112|nr:MULTISPECIES: FAD/NAD(P)-binding oxidoreductase [Sphingomonas]
MLKHDIVIIGGGAGGLAAAASLLRRDPELDIAVIEPREFHDYQPGYTLIGAGVFNLSDVRRPMAKVMPRGVTWLRTSAKSLKPNINEVVLVTGVVVGYRILIVATGNRLDFDAISGLTETLGKNGVTSNYRSDLAPYTWELTQGLRAGRALFTQPPMPIKCAGAPQKAMYLSANHWERTSVLRNIGVEFHSAAPTIFGVADYVPALEETIERYGIDPHFESNLVAVDGRARVATFRSAKGEITRSFDMLHVSPPQKPVEIVTNSLLADRAGYVDVDPMTLQHKHFANVFALGDIGGMSNAKTAAAVRKQAPVVAENVEAVFAGESPHAIYDGYGSCPLTVEKGKILLAEFGYGGVLLPSFPKFVIDGTKPSRLAWHLKKDLLPAIYWDAMLKGREWLASPAEMTKAA